MFEKKTWQDRQVQHPERFQISNLNDESDVVTYDVTRQDAEGTVSQAGDAFSAANMNDLEQRLYNAFLAAQSTITDLIGSVYPVGSIYTSFSIDKTPDQLFGGTWQRLRNRYLKPVSTSQASGSNVGNSSIVLSKTLSGNFNFSGIIKESSIPLLEHFHTYIDNSNNFWPHYTVDYPYYSTSDSYFTFQQGYICGKSRTEDIPTYVNKYNQSLSKSTQSAGNGKKHSHSFGENGKINGRIDGTPVSIDISQPYRTIYAWRRIS
jgi:hypothetical protein